MKSFIAKLTLHMLLALNCSAFFAMDKPLAPKSNIFSKAKAQVKNIISSKTKSEKATQELIKLINSDQEITVLQVQPLIQAGADINAIGADGKSLLTKASECECKRGFSLAEWAIKNGARVQDSALLILNAMNNNLPFVKLLIDHGADVNVKGKGGIRPLYHAVYNQNEKMVQLLIESGADVNAETNNNIAPLDVLITSTPLSGPNEIKSLAIAKLLIDNEAVVSQKNLEDAQRMSKRLFEFLISYSHKKKLE